MPHEEHGFGVVLRRDLVVAHVVDSADDGSECIKVDAFGVAFHPQKTSFPPAEVHELFQCEDAERGELVRSNRTDVFPFDQGRGHRRTVIAA